MVVLDKAEKNSVSLNMWTVGDFRWLKIID